MKILLQLVQNINSKIRIFWLSLRSFAFVFIRQKCGIIIIMLQIRESVNNDPQRIEMQINDLIDSVQLETKRSCRAKTLSGGQKRKLSTVISLLDSKVKIFFTISYNNKGEKPQK